MKTQVFALSIGLTWLFVSRVTMAGSQGTETADTAKAADRFQQAVELYREGSYEGALAEFRKAYQLSPSFQVLYNIAQTQYALHDYVGAYKTLMQYMTEGTGEIPADRRAQVDEMYVKLGERIANLQISTNVTGADIRVDDVSVGTSPLPGLIPVNVGKHKVSALKAGSPEAVRILTVAGKERVKIEFQISESASTSEQPVSSVESTSAPNTGMSSAPLIVETQAPAKPGRTGLIVSLSTTAALAVGTGVFGFLALKAQHDLNDQINTYPNTKDKIEDARSKSKTYGYVTDALGAATLISGGVALYIALTHRGDSPKAKSSETNIPIVLAPTVGGMVLQGSF
jgi:tetratricopeptide (TPR) repeat protein